MTRPLRSMVGIGLFLALFSTIRAVGTPTEVPADHATCVADVDLPLQVEIVDAPAVAMAGADTRATCRFVVSGDAERVDVEFRPAGATLVGSAEWSQVAVRAGDEIEVPLGARLAPDALRGTVDVVVTAWIDGHPYERGATWSLTTRPPETGRVVGRPGRLSVREVSVGRATR